MHLAIRWRHWFRPVTIWVPSWPLALALTAAVAVGVVVIGRNLYGFLAPVRPETAATVVIVETWAERGYAKTIANAIESGPTGRVILVGSPLDPLSDFSKFPTSADLWAARLQNEGVDPSHFAVVRVPGAIRHRTAHAALAVGRHLDSSEVTAANLLTFGPHARRSALIYEQALPPGTRLGVIALAPRSYDPSRWWRSSAGVRTVLSELIAYVYVRFFGNEVDAARREWNGLSDDQRHVGPTVPEP